MTPMSPSEAQRIGLVDYVFPSHGVELDDYIRSHIWFLLQPACLKQGLWKAKVDLSPTALALARAQELGEMAKDFWSPRAQRYESRRFDFVRKVKATQTPLRFAKHRRVDSADLDEEEMDRFDDVEPYREIRDAQLRADVHKQLAETALQQRAVVGGQATKNKEPMWGCYFTPPADILTPQETPQESPAQTPPTDVAHDAGKVPTEDFAALKLAGTA